MVPHCLPAQLVATRIQQELSRSFLPSRSQWNCTLTRLYLSGKISSPGGPTTVANCTPRMDGIGVTRCGRYGSANGIQAKVLVYSYAASPARSGCLPSCSTDVSTYLLSSEKCLES